MVKEWVLCWEECCIQKFVFLPRKCRKISTLWRAYFSIGWAQSLGKAAVNCHRLIFSSPPRVIELEHKMMRTDCRLHQSTAINQLPRKWKNLVLKNYQIANGGNFTLQRRKFVKRNRGCFFISNISSFLSETFIPRFRKKFTDHWEFPWQWSSFGVSCRFQPSVFWVGVPIRLDKASNWYWWWWKKSWSRSFLIKVELQATWAHENHWENLETMTGWKQWTLQSLPGCYRIGVSFGSWSSLIGLWFFWGPLWELSPNPVKQEQPNIRGRLSVAISPMPLQNRVMVCIHCGNISGSRERFLKMI